ncbi:E3 ubiquitin-protein ligase cip8 [Phtheirospermum japonicum]|uniref:RING-type E3 ubiquitin transferase n=1 Tax=Phtheirospermum japonicum TaxID=374723 RepID=A0A830BMP6_9LAMI|nr:E3 ubiquitin-protein ligase cip8 [Phtheirospermum japonicum]
MAEAPSIQSPPRTHLQSGSGLEFAQYWCYHCDKRVAVETLPDLPDIVCHECKNGFVESMAAASVPTPAADPMNDPALGNQFIQVLRLIAQAAREEDMPTPLPSDPSDDDYLRIELDGWDNDNDGEDDDDEERSVEVVNEEDADNLERYTENNNRSDGEEDEDGIEVIEPPPGEDEEAASEEVMRRRRRDVLRLRLRDLTSRAASRRNRILDWAEILMGLEDHSIELRLQVPESDTYVGNPGDYVDAAEYEALLQNLAESDSGARRGAPPAAKVAVEGLESVVIEKEENVMGCAICKDTVNVGEIAKNLPCGHGYHGECIVPWLGSRNTCPVCRFELPTDDLEYEEDRKKRVVVAGLRATSSGSSSSSGGGGIHDSGLE